MSNVAVRELVGHDVGNGGSVQGLPRGVSKKPQPDIVVEALEYRQADPVVQIVSRYLLEDAEPLELPERVNNTCVVIQIGLHNLVLRVDDHPPDPSGDHIDETQSDANCEHDLVDDRGYIGNSVHLVPVVQCVDLN